MLSRMIDTLELIKFQHTLFALPFAVLAACYAAEGVPTGEKILWILVAMVTARSCAMAVNRLADHQIDAKNPRTQERHLPAGKLSRGYVWGFTILMAGLFFLSAGMLNRMCLYLSPVALLVLCGYSYTKRFTSLCHFVLGLSLGMAPVGAWLGVTGTFHPFPIVLGTAILFWVAGFDIMYAAEDAEFDRAEGLKSIPANVGVKNALRFAAICHFIALGGFLGVGFLGLTGTWYWAGVGVVAALLIYEHLIVRPDDLRKLNRAFFHINAVVSGVLLVAALVDLFQA